MCMSRGGEWRRLDRRVEREGEREGREQEGRVRTALLEAAGAGFASFRRDFLDSLLVHWRPREGLVSGLGLGIKLCRVLGWN